jgi:hypothetical protein
MNMQTNDIIMNPQHKDPTATSCMPRISMELNEIRCCNASANDTAVSACTPRDLCYIERDMREKWIYVS